MKKLFKTGWLFLILAAVLLFGCTSVDLNASIPTFDTQVDPEAWAQIRAGEYLSGQHNEPASIEYDYEIMINDVTVAQYVTYLNQALAEGSVKLSGEQITGFYPGDEFHGLKHEVEIKAADYVFVPVNDPASRFTFDGSAFTAIPQYENHPMTNVSWFGARGYCEYSGSRLPLEAEWEKAARGPQDSRPFPWGEEISYANANYYKSRDPFEEMSSVGSRTSPVGFYNGQTYDGYQTADSASPYGLYDMAGNVWQWTGDVYEGMHYRFMRGGSKDTYGMDLRIWVRNNATPTYYSPGVGFRCVREP
jgi:formylglycine-generating enzyme required for sulfatase activity